MSIVYDTFTEASDTDIASHVSDSGHHWQYSDYDIGAGTMVVKGGLGWVIGHDYGGAYDVYVTDDNLSSADYWVSATGKIPTTDPQAPDVMYVWARTNAAASIGYAFKLDSSGNYDCRSTVTGIFSGTVSSFDSTINHTIKLQCQGSTISGWIDGNLVGSQPNSDVSAANHMGMGLLNNTSLPSSLSWITTFDSGYITPPAGKTHRDLVMIGVK